MKLIGNLKEKVEKAETREEKKELIKNAGMELNDEELENVAGGGMRPLRPLEDRISNYNRYSN